MITHAEACALVLRYRWIVSRRDDAKIHSSVEHETHYLITYAVPSLEDSTRIFQYGYVIIEKQTGNLYHAPSRSAHPIVHSEFPSNRRQLVQLTGKDLDEMESRMELMRKNSQSVESL